MSETAKQRKEREEREAAEKAADSERKDATATPEPVTGKGRAHSPEADESRGGSVSAPPGTDVVVTAPNANAASFAAGEQTFEAERTARAGKITQPTFPQALPREQQEENASALAKLQAANVTGTSDGVATVYPPVAGPTNMGLTPAEVLVNLDDGAVDEQGRLVGTYYDDIEREKADAMRERIEQRSSSEESRAAAARIRQLASSPFTPAADAGKRPGEQGLVNPSRITSSERDQANNPLRRASEQGGATHNAPAGARP